MNRTMAATPKLASRPCIYYSVFTKGHIIYMHTIHVRALKRTVEPLIHAMKLGMSLDQYREAIGSFNNVKFILVPASNVRACAAWVSVSNVLITIIVLLMLLGNDIQLNPGPGNHFTVSQCNIGGIQADLSDLSASHLSVRYIFISESTLSENIANDIIKINGYQIPFRRDRDHNGGGLLT